MATGLVGVMTFITKIITAFFLLVTGKPEEAKEAFLSAFEGLGPALSEIFEGLVGIVVELGVGIINGIIAMVAEFTTVVANWIVDILESFGIIDEETAALWRDMLTGVTDLKDDMIAKITEWKDGALEQLESLLDLASIIWEKMWGEDGFIRKWVKDATDAVVEFIVDLWDKLVGHSLFQDISDDISDIWSDIFGEDGWLLGLVDSAITGIVALGTKFKDAGASIIDSLFAGIKAAWATGKEVLGKAWSWFKDQLPGSEPRDPTSPFANLAEKGAAIWENVLAGMGGVDVSGAVNAQISGMVDKIQIVGAGAGAGAVGPQRVFHIETLILQGVQEPEDLINKLQALTIPGA